MKKLVKILLPIIALTSISACAFGGGTISKSNATEIGASYTLKSNSIKYTVLKCNGDITYTFNVKESDALNIAAKIDLSLGALTITLKNEEDEELYKDIVIESCVYDIPLEEYGKYNLLVHHDDFKGTYNFNWSNKK